MTKIGDVTSCPADEYTAVGKVNCDWQHGTPEKPSSASLRSPKERMLQTISFELIGVVFVSPVYAKLAGASLGKGAAMIALLSAVILIWTPLFNTLFDLVEHRCTKRTACERPHRLRLRHAVLHEVSAVAMTCPLLMWVGGHSLASALALNLGLSITYTIYTYVFHILYDFYRPVQKLGGR